MPRLIKAYGEFSPGPYDVLKPFFKFNQVVHKSISSMTILISLVPVKWAAAPGLAREWAVSDCWN
jgi:hypothetical protein